MIEHFKGDIFNIAREGHWDFVVHGCNCFHTMGSGIAKTVKQLYPEAYLADSATPMARKDKLGTWSSALTHSGFVIINLYTQYGYNYGTENLDMFDYRAFERGLIDLSNTYPGCSWLFPYIGMGRAGGDPEKIKATLVDFANLVACTGGRVGLVEFQA